MVHDDTFVRVNLLNLLASYDHNKPLVLGSTVSGQALPILLPRIES